MDKELIAMCDCPEIQEYVFGEHGGYTAIVAKDGGYPSKDDIVYIPSVSWLLREIEVAPLQSVELGKHPDGFYARFTDCSSWSNFPHGDSPEKALLHLLMWQKGKVWKDNEWRAK